MIYEHNQHQFERSLSRANESITDPRMRRDKTRSIPMTIRKPTHHEIESPSSLDINTSKQMYDMVTWRMYDRITNARLRRRQMQERHEEKYCGGYSTFDINFLLESPADAQNYSDSESFTYLSDEEEEGDSCNVEIFYMEMDM